MAGAFALFMGLGLAVSRPPVRIEEDREVTQCREWIQSHSPRPSDRTALTKIVSPNTICFDGQIYSWTLKDATSWSDRAEQNRTAHLRLVIRSTGGDADAAIDLAERLQRLNTEVTIVDYCMSSCANYFFAGLARRRVVPGALILFHGGYSMEERPDFARSLDEALHDPALARTIPNPIQWRADELKKFDGSVARQNALYRRVGVDSLVVTGMSSVDESAIPAAACGGRKGARRSVLFFDTDQLRRLGIMIDEGKPATDPSEVDHRLAQFGFSYTACAAPATYFNHRLRKEWPSP